MFASGHNHKKITSIPFLFVYVCLALASIAPRSTAADSSAPALFLAPASPVTNVASSPSSPVSTDSAILRRQSVALDRTLLNQARLGQLNRLMLNFFNDKEAAVECRVEKRIIRAADSYTLSGTITGDPRGEFSITVQNDAVLADAVTGTGRHCQLGLDATGHAEVRELQDTLLPTCGNDPSLQISLPPDRHPAQTAPDGTPVFDLLVVYTPAARTGAGGQAAIEALAHQAVDLANQAYNNSHINAQMRLVHVAEINYTESGSFGTDLTRLQKPLDGQIDSVHTLRETHGADLVSMFINNNGTGTAGLGYVMTSLSSQFSGYAFTVIHYSYAGGTNYTLAHEAGHNLGCAHAIADGGSTVHGSGLYYYSHGWRFNSDADRTVMAYNPGTRRLYFSNPNVSYNGGATGLAGDADNAHSINQSAATVAGFKQTIDTLALSPGTDFDLSGFSGGPFSPSSCQFTVSNQGLGALDWTASTPAAWLTISNSGGTLAGGSASDTSTVSLNGLATSMVPGLYQSFVYVRNVLTGTTRTLTVNLTVLAKSEVWVDFNFSGVEDGSESRPYNTLAEVLNDVSTSGTIKIKPGFTAEIPFINQPVRIEAPSGSVTIGQ